MASIGEVTRQRHRFGPSVDLELSVVLRSVRDDLHALRSHALARQRSTDRVEVDRACRARLDGDEQTADLRVKILDAFQAPKGAPGALDSQQSFKPVDVDHDASQPGPFDRGGAFRCRGTGGEEDEGDGCAHGYQSHATPKKNRLSFCVGLSGLSPPLPFERWCHW